MTGEKWKKLFIVLLACNILVISFMLILINWPIKGEEISNKSSKEEDIQFQVHTTRDDLNQLINQYLDKEGLTGGFHYEVYLTDEVELYGKMPFFNREVDLKLTFKPIAQENGDLVLKQESISVGEMNLPVSYVMNFINKRYKTPDWVTIQPKEQRVYVSLQEMKLKSDVRVKAKKFDLEHNDISFLLTVPSVQP
ncbi:YpmS family protein [Peribacillus asahii]|uniref:YpmS family protein n=1 Tax=Peribacillus asahii TaxID=228899 RepID=UPI002079F072|nr:YpmS family protein [Peribacillus asahii]USK58480.1 YpmS family protein [Peribacillus asahii]